MNITRSIVSERERALLSGDYAAYHAQASRRIHKLRKRLGSATPKGRKYVPKTAVTAENVASNGEWVQLLLALSERSWADAKVMKQSQSPEATQKPLLGSTKRQIVSRLQRAIAYAENLVGVIQAGPTDRSTDLLEAKAYLAMLRGTKHFEQSRWQPCLEQYALVRLVYVVLGESAHTELYRDLLSTIVEPSIRYAAYQLKLPRTKPITDIVIENFPASESDTKAALGKINSSAFETSSAVAAASDSAKDIPPSISWRGRDVKLEDAAISQALALAHQHEATLNDKFAGFSSGTLDQLALAALYDDVITARQDAADATKSAIDELVAEGVDPGDRRIQSLQITRTAVNYGVIEYRIGRNRVLCGADDGLRFETVSSKPARKAAKSGKQGVVAKQESIGRRISRLRERVALYDAILQSLDSTLELPGVVADETFTAELSGKRSYFRALKCLAIGRSHALKAETTSALALYNRTLGLAQTAQAALATTSTASGAPKLEVSAAALTAAATHLEHLVTQYRALCNLESVATTATPSTGSEPPLIQQLHLNRYNPHVDLSNIVNYPIKLVPIPVKPLFFDIAWNYIQYPSQGGRDGESLANGHEVEGKGSPSVEKEDKPAAKRGWFGFGR
ncbi:hypothetical protein DV735_g3876, partial [Chaetothyriales sp. CBS 134920]